MTNRMGISSQHTQSGVSSKRNNMANHFSQRQSTIGRLGHFAVWSVETLNKKLFGVGGIALAGILSSFVGATLYPERAQILIIIGCSVCIVLAGGLALAYTRERFRRIMHHHSETTASVRKELQATEARVVSLQQTVHSLESSVLSDVRKSLDAQTRNISAMKSDLSELLCSAKRQDFSMSRSNSSNASIFQGFNRYLNQESIEVFETKWLPLLELELNTRALGYMAHHICLTEDRCAGRLATTVEAALLRTLVARSVKNKNLSILEIGTLFGIGVAAIYEICRGCFETINLTVVDPLDGYYEQGLLDINTKMPVSQPIFRHNMGAMKIPDEDFEIIADLSTEESAIERAAQKQFDLLIIDGDHSEAGVAHDFRHFSSTVRRGGYILFDDYGTPEWPDIKAFVDRDVMPRTDLEFIGSDWRTAVFRVLAGG